MDPDGYFISYTAADRAWAEWIASELGEVGATTVLQVWDFRPGDNFVVKMHEALIEMGTVIAVLSHRYLTSRFAEMEWTAAIAQGASRLLPIRIDEVEPTGVLAPVVYVDLYDCEEETARQRLRAAVASRGSRGTAPFPGRAATPFPTGASSAPIPIRSGRPELVERLTTTISATTRPVLVTGLPSTEPAAVLLDAVRRAVPHREPVVVRSRPSEPATTTLLDVLKSAVTGTAPELAAAAAETLESLSPSAVGLVAARVPSDVVVVIPEADRIPPDVLTALIEQFSGRMLGLAMETTSDPLTSVPLARFVVPPMDREEANGFLSERLRDLFGTEADPRVLDRLPDTVWALPGVLDGMLPMLAQLTPEFADWFSADATVLDAEHRMARFVAGLDPTELRMLAAVRLSEGTDVRAAIEATSELPTAETLALLLQLLRRGLVLRDGDRYLVPGPVSRLLDATVVGSVSSVLGHRLLDRPSVQPRDVELAAVAVAIAHRSYGIVPDLLLANPAVLDAVNGLGHWETYLLLIDTALQHGNLRGPEAIDLRLRRVRKLIQLGRFDDASRDLDAVSATTPSDSRAGVLDVLSHRVLLLFGSGRYEDALVVARRADLLAVELDDPHRLAKLLNVLGNILLVEGRPADALGAYDRALAAATRAGDAVAAIDARIGRVRGAIAIGGATELDDDLGDLAQLCEADGRRTQLGQVEYLRAVLLECDDPELAEAHACRARDASDPASATYGLADGLLWRLKRFAEVAAAKDRR